MKDTHPFTTLSSRTVYQNPWIRVREDKVTQLDGTPSIYGVVESKDSVMIVVLNNSQEVYLIYTYSYPDKSWNWELPGGGGDGERAIDASKRELVEETGITANTWEFLGKTRVCNGIMTERQSTYLARNLSFAANHGEAIISHGAFYSLADIHAMIRDGKINDGQSMAALYLLEQWLSRQT